MALLVNNCVNKYLNFFNNHILGVENRTQREIARLCYTNYHISKSIKLINCKSTVNVNDHLGGKQRQEGTIL